MAASEQRLIKARGQAQLIVGDSAWRRGCGPVALCRHRHCHPAQAPPTGVSNRPAANALTGHHPPMSRQRTCASGSVRPGAAPVLAKRPEPGRKSPGGRLKWIVYSPLRWIVCVPRFFPSCDRSASALASLSWPRHRRSAPASAIAASALLESSRQNSTGSQKFFCAGISPSSTARGAFLLPPAIRQWWPPSGHQAPPTLKLSFTSWLACTAPLAFAEVPPPFRWSRFDAGCLARFGVKHGHPHLEAGVRAFGRCCWCGSALPPGDRLNGDQRPPQPGMPVRAIWLPLQGRARAWRLGRQLCRFRARGRRMGHRPGLARSLAWIQWATWLAMAFLLPRPHPAPV